MKLFEPCVNNNQCNGTNNAGNCTEIGHNTLCYCQDDYLDFKGRCIKGNKAINEGCEANIQCTGTEHASVCGENQTCTCDKGFIRLKEECVSGNLTLGQSCVHDTQCTGTEYVGTCIEGVCFCNEGYDLYQLQCLPAKEKLTWFSEYENQLILIAVGGWFGMVACSVTTLFCALKRRKSKPTRIECCNSSHLPITTIHYSVADNTVFGIRDHVEGVNQESYIYDQAKNIYEKAHQMDQQQETENVYNDAYERDQDDETVNVYSVSEPQCYHREEEDSVNDTYNHLHQKPLQMSDDTYGVPKSISIPL